MEGRILKVCVGKPCLYIDDNTYQLVVFRLEGRILKVRVGKLEIFMKNCVLRSEE